ncbi:MAG TPA: DUF5652 family protein [Patescibacteria group bacterium]|nr:DUF5652 family protein [Patescibacteria group bacterium]
MDSWLQQNPLATLFLLWSLPWKGAALWKAARQGEKVWFVVLLLLQTVGVLEILYLFVFSKMKKEPKNFPPSV